ncbi:hypothetical protein DVK02_11260 [Halobellus sp. Atlit-31R]|nr:hypothetical protein DVK02_11260 [Halobellus sp. Atlit-31R]
MVDGNDNSRRRFLQLTGIAAVAGLAGCSGDGGGDGGEATTEAPTEAEPETATATPSGDTVPEEYATATALGGIERDPSSLSTKSDVQYQEEPNEGQQCSGCTLYIEDKNGDGMGACAIVEGNIDPEGWCISYAPHQE